MTRYTICFNEEQEADIIRWLDAQVNKSMSLKALIERSIEQEGYNDIFKLTWKRSIHNPPQRFHEPERTAEFDTQQTKRKRGRPRKNDSSVLPETGVTKQTSEVVTVPAGQPDMPQPITAVPHQDGAPASEIPVVQTMENVPDKQPAVLENQVQRTDTVEPERGNDGYRRPGKVDFDMSKFMG